MPDNFPPELKRFVEQYIESVPQLEALLLLRDNPQKGWNAADIAKALYIPEEAATSLVVDFLRRGFIRPDPHDNTLYFYRAPNEGVDRLIGELGAAYHDRRVAVISLIYSKPINKVQTFADAFRFGRENPQ